MRLTLNALASLLTISLGAAALAEPTAERRPHAGMLRYPDISATQIVFAYGGQLWLAPRDGGTAQPLASPPGDPSFPRFSDDGKRIAFIANYDGNSDLYVTSVDGGAPTRVTHHPGTEVLNGWTPDGKLLFFARGYFDLNRQSHLLTVAPEGGLPERLPVPYGAVAAISPDGQWLAYTLQAWDHRTWKRYVGGTATDIWLYNLKDNSARRVTESPGTDSQPMWQDGKIYYMSDGGPEHKLNIWVVDPQSMKREQITTFADYDIKWPAVGPGPAGKGEIVFQHGPDLKRLDLATRQTISVPIFVPGDLTNIRPRRVEMAGSIPSFEISATGKRAAFEARGDLWTVPAKNGSPRNLTRTAGVAERDPSWSPDGKWVAYFSDKTGEYELYVMRAGGQGEPRQLTGLDAANDESMKKRVFRYAPRWSADSKHIAFVDKAANLYVTTIESGSTKLVDTEPWGNVPQFAWSHDASKIVYTRGGDNQQSAIWIWDRATGQTAQLTSGVFNDTWPTFDRDGKYLYYASNRHFRGPIYEDIGSAFVYTNTDVLVVVPLLKKTASPFAPTSDEEVAGPKKSDGDKKGKGKDKDKKKDKDDKKKPANKTDGEVDEGDKPAASDDEDSADDAGKDDQEDEKPLEIDVDGFEARGVALTVTPGAFSNLAVNDAGQLLYVRRGRPGTDEKSRIMLFDLKKAAGGGEAESEEEEEDDESQIVATSGDRSIADDKKDEQLVLGDVRNFTLSADGKKLIAGSGDSYAIVDAKPGQKMKPLALGGLSAEVDPKAEWRQMFNEAWRLERDFFYAANMHGLDWPAVKKQYEPMLADCVSRADVGYVISEMIAELNVGHAYYFGDDDPGAPQVSVGLLAADFECAEGAYRIKTIYAGAPWDSDGRGPLSQPGVSARVGDYLLAVNGEPVDAKLDPWAAFQGLAGKTVVLTVSDKATLEPLTDEPSKEESDDKEGDDKKKDGKKKDEDGPKFTGQRNVVVKLLSGEQDNAVRYRAWVERSRKYVDEKSGGQVGYIHVPDTGINGQNELFRRFYGQRHKAALIVDERWNGGGQLPNRFIELLDRPPTNFWAVRDGKSSPSPSDGHFGPKCMLINQLAGSGGDMFPFLFKFHKLGKLIGTRTWGGLVGISGNPDLIDGAGVTAPTFGFFNLDGTWGIEGWGVDPDIEVIDDPSKMVGGVDVQLDAGIAEMLKEIKEKPFVAPKRPAEPDRSGMGIKPEDK